MLTTSLGLKKPELTDNADLITFISDNMDTLNTLISGKAASSHTHNASDINAGTLALARIPTGTTSTTVALGNHNHTLDSLSNVTITAPAAGHFLEWSGTAWINNALVAADIPNLDTAKITTGTFALARIPTGTTSTTVALGNHNHNSITYTDTRSSDFTPFTYPGISMHLKTNTTDGLSDGGSFHGVLHLTQWGDSSGGRPHQLAFTDNGNIFHRIHNGTSYLGWQKIWDEGNFNPSTKSDTSHNHTLDSLSNTTITSLATGHFLKWNGTVWVNSLLAANDIPSLDTGKITSGTFALARIPTGTTSTTVALGNHTHAIGSLSDVTITTPTAGHTIRYNGSSWVNSFPSLNDNTDVSTVLLTSGQILRYDGTKWVNDSIAAADIKSGVLGVARGGTGLTSITFGYIPYGDGTSALLTSSSLTYLSSKLSAPYITATGTTQTAGAFYAGTTNPTTTNRLNYSGYLYATKFFGGLVASSVTSDPASPAVGEMWLRSDL